MDCIFLNNGIVYELYLVKLFKNVWAIGYWVQLTLTNTTDNLTIHLYAYLDIYPLYFVCMIYFFKKAFFLMCIFHLIITMSINMLFLVLFTTEHSISFSVYYSLKSWVDRLSFSFNFNFSTAYQFFNFFFHLFLLLFYLLKDFLSFNTNVSSIF